MRYDKLLQYLVMPLSLIVAALIIYHLGLFNRLMFPNPVSIVKQFFALLLSSEMYTDLALTLSRVISGTAISILFGIPAGLILGYFNRIYTMFEFLIDFFRSIPATALFPLFMLFFGIGNMSKVLLSAWIAMLVIMVNTSYGVRHANKAYLKIAKVYNTSRKFLFMNIIFPGALPSIFSGLRIGVSLVLIVVIVSEMFFGSVNGLGHAILDAQLRYQIPEMYALIIITGLIGYALNKLFLSIEVNLIHWTRSEH